MAVLVPKKRKKTSYLTLVLSNIYTYFINVCCFSNTYFRSHRYGSCKYLSPELVPLSTSNLPLHQFYFFCKKGKRVQVNAVANV